MHPQKKAVAVSQNTKLNTRYSENTCKKIPWRHETTTQKDLVDLVGYCGLYCNACGIRQGKIRTAADNLLGVIAAYGFDKMMPELANWEPSFKSYAQFTQVLDGLVKMFGDCPGCLGGGGDPNCKVRQCAKQKHYRTCAQCDQTEICESLAPYRKGHPALVQDLKTITQKGAEGYAEDAQQKVDEGYSYLEEQR